jgi:phosphopantothenoylcysteine decarboxylase/phosphopantothenate--cysteine ligase
VTLVYGPGTAKPPSGAKVIPIETTEEMLEAVVNELKAAKHHAAILTAAAADYGAADRKMEKTPSGKGEWVIKLKPLPKVVENVKRHESGIYLVGFKAEYNVSDEELVDRAYKRLSGVDMDLIVANDVSRKGAGFGTETNEVFIVDKGRNVNHLDTRSKDEIAKAILDRVNSELG